MSYPIENIIEKAIDNQVSSLLGNNDTNLQTILKMSLMEEVNQMNKDEMSNVLAKIRASNEMEHYWIAKEYTLTYDLNGCIISTDELYGQTQKDSSGVVLEPKRSIPESG